MVALFLFLGAAIAEDEVTIYLDEIVVTGKKEKKKPMEGWELHAPGAIQWSLEEVPHHIVMVIQGSDVQLAFSHSGYEVEDYCVHQLCPTLRVTDDGWLLFTHYAAGSIPFTYRVRTLPNMWRVTSVSHKWQWLYRSTFNAEN